MPHTNEKHQETIKYKPTTYIEFKGWKDHSLIGRVYSVTLTAKSTNYCIHTINVDGEDLWIEEWYDENELNPTRIWTQEEFMSLLGKEDKTTTNNKL